MGHRNGGHDGRRRGGGWFLGIQPQLNAANAASESRTSEAARNAASERLLVTLKKDFEGIGELKDSNATLRRSVPSSAQLSTFVTELNALSGQNSVAVTTITVSDAKAYTPPVIVAAAVTGAAASPTPSPTASAAPVVAAPVAPQAPPLVTNPKITAANFIAIPITLKISGQYANVLNFVKGLQAGERLFLVTNLSTKTVVPPTVDADITGLIYVLLADGAK